MHCIRKFPVYRSALLVFWNTRKIFEIEQNEYLNKTCNFDIFIQTRLQNQERRHTAAISAQQERIYESAKRLTDSLTSLRDLSEHDPGSGEDFGTPADSAQDDEEKTMAALKASHDKIVADILSKHRLEMERVIARKDLELAEEARATRYLPQTFLSIGSFIRTLFFAFRAALEIMEKAYEDRLKAEVDKIICDYRRLRGDDQKWDFAHSCSFCVAFPAIVFLCHRYNLC